MKIAIGSDHRGYDAKERLTALLKQLDHEVHDHGTNSNESCDYPDLALKVATEVSDGTADRGVLLCGSGLGMSIAANKVCKVRAALCHDEMTAEMSRRHNDANVLCIAADLVGDTLMQQIVRTWLSTQFEAGRHARRIEKIARFENERGC